MRHSVHLLTILTLLTVSACHHPASPLAGTAQVRASAGSQARSVAGRALVSWKDAASRRATLARLGVKESQIVGTGGDEVLQLPSGMDPTEFRREVGDAALAVEPDYIMRLPALAADEAEAFDSGTEAKKKASPASRAQYALQKVGAPAAWKIQRGRAEVKIAIIDTGADMEHPDLKNQIVASTSMLGWKSRLGFASARDDNGHGTHCAGVAAAEADNNEGIDGMAPGCKLLIVKTLGADGSGATSDIARGVHWAIDQGAGVISMSVGSSDDAKPMREAVQRALAAGIVVVAAMGNEGKQIKNYPAAYPGVIAVGATNSSDKPAGYSTKGSWISVAAPGTGIWSTTPTYKVALNADGDMTATYGKLSGTSMATPLVAGLAALLKSQHSNWSPAQIKQSIERSAVALEGGFNNRTGHGRISASAALGSRKAD